MEDREKLIQSVKTEITKLRNLGEHGRKGSDHLSYRSISVFEIDTVKKLKVKNEVNYKLICRYDIYTETEFLHDSDMDELYTEHYIDKFLFDSNFELLKVEDMR
jgi:hypothetical protein